MDPKVFEAHLPGSPAEGMSGGGTMDFDQLSGIQSIRAPVVKVDGIVFFSCLRLCDG